MFAVIDVTKCRAANTKRFLQSSLYQHKYDTATLCCQHIKRISKHVIRLLTLGVKVTLAVAPTLEKSVQINLGSTEI